MGRGFGRSGWKIIHLEKLPETVAKNDCRFHGICARDGMRLFYYIIRYDNEIYAVTPSEIQKQIGGIDSIRGELEHKRKRMRCVLIDPETKKQFSESELLVMPWLKNELSPVTPEGPVEPMNPIVSRYLLGPESETFLENYFEPPVQVPRRNRKRTTLPKTTKRSKENSSVSSTRKLDYSNPQVQVPRRNWKTTNLPKTRKRNKENSSVSSTRNSPKQTGPTSSKEGTPLHKQKKVPAEELQ